MTDALGWRRKLGVLIPSTNTIVAPDFCRMAVPGVTAHYARIHIRDARQETDAGFEQVHRQMLDDLDQAIARIMTAEPDYLVAGMSAETFWGGLEGNRRFKQHVTGLSGLPVATGAEAANRALGQFNAKRIGVLTPYQPIGDEQVARFFTDLGFEVVAVKGLRCPTTVSIAHVGEDTLRQALLEVNARDADALIQVGTNLSMIRLADEAERWLGKPVVAINAAIWWMALRDNGIRDTLDGCGRLLREH